MVYQGLGFLNQLISIFRKLYTVNGVNCNELLLVTFWEVVDKFNRGLTWLPRLEYDETIRCVISATNKLLWKALFSFFDSPGVLVFSWYERPCQSMYPYFQRILRLNVFCQHCSVSRKILTKNFSIDGTDIKYKFWTFTFKPPYP